jgi:hypothetical protein
MEHLISEMPTKLTFLNEDKKWVTLTGYAVTDILGNCIIILYGENNRDKISNYLKNI